MKSTGRTWICLALVGLAAAIGCAVLGGQAVAEPTVSSCRMTNLSLHRLLISNPTGWDRTGLQFTNSGSRACVLAGFPTIALRDRKGPIPFDYRHVGNPPRVVVRPKGSAFVIFGKFRCDLGARRTAATGDVWLKPRAEARAEFSMHVGVGLCKPGIGGEARTVTVTPFEPTLRAAYLHYFPRS